MMQNDNMKNDMVKRCLLKVLGGYAFVFLVSFILAFGWKIKAAQIVVAVVALPWDFILMKLAESFWPSLKGPIGLCVILFISFFINSFLLYYLISRRKLRLLWDSLLEFLEEEGRSAAILADKIKKLAISIITGKFFENFKNPAFRKNFFKTLLLLIPLVLLLIWPLIGSPDMTYIKVRGAKKAVVELRNDVLRYKDVTGEYPATLSAMKQYGHCETVVALRCVCFFAACSFSVDGGRFAKVVESEILRLRSG